MEKYNVNKLSNEESDKVFQALKDIKEPSEIGTILAYYIGTFSEKDRLDVIRKILKRLTTDLLTGELPKGELERIRKVASQI